MTPKTTSTSEQASTSRQAVSDRVRDIGERAQNSIKETGRQVQSKLQEADFNEATIPDAFRNVPKLISPRVHSWLDFAVTGYFLVVGVVSAIRGKGRVSAAAFINGGMVATISMLTDYEGTGQKPISFKMHGTMDAVQATTAALAPVLHGFAGEPEAKLFYGQAANELAVIASTDWDAGMPEASQRRAA